MSPVLILCAHGTRDPEGQQVILDVAQQVRVALEVEVRVAYVDVQEPSIDAVVESIPASEEEITAIVVPFLLAGGYHVHVDIARAVKDRRDVIATPPLGPDPRLIAVLLDRIASAGVHPTATLVLAPAGSSDPRSTRDTERVLDELRLTWDGPVRVGYASGLEPSVARAVMDARAFGKDEEDSDVAVVSYLLAPGQFQKVLESAEADHVTGPLAPDDRIIEVIAQRYSDADGA
jgi:sirohydrochlorin ferrochelatase